MELYAQVRRAVLAEGFSRREAARRFGIDRKTVAKMCAHSAPGPAQSRSLSLFAEGRGGDDAIRPIGRVLATHGFIFTETGIGGFGAVHLYVARKL